MEKSEGAESPARKAHAKALKKKCHASSRKKVVTPRTAHKQPAVAASSSRGRPWPNLRKGRKRGLTREASHRYKLEEKGKVHQKARIWT